MVFAQIEDYKYYREINTKDLRDPIWIELSKGILDYSESSGNDIPLSSPRECSSTLFFDEFLNKG